MTKDNAHQHGATPWVLGLIGVTMFALTLPMTRIATGSATAPRLDPVFVTAARAGLAALFSAIYLISVRAPVPNGTILVRLVLAGLGNVVIYPLCLALAMPHVSGAHAAVMSGLGPLATSLSAVVLLGARGSKRFWALSLVGLLLILGYAALSEWRQSGEIRLSYADIVMLVGIFGASAAYVLGADLSKSVPPEQVISWILIIYAPLNAVVAFFYRPSAMPDTAPTLALLYVAVFSMWASFFFWYRGLALGGAMRIGQVQLLQPFLAMFAAIPLLGEPFDPLSLFFCVAIVALVALARRG